MAKRFGLGDAGFRRLSLVRENPAPDLFPEGLFSDRQTYPQPICGQPA